MDPGTDPSPGIENQQPLRQVAPRFDHAVVDEHDGTAGAASPCRHHLAPVVRQGVARFHQHVNDPDSTWQRCVRVVWCLLVGPDCCR